MPATRTTRTPLLLSLLLCAPLGGCSDQGDDKSTSPGTTAVVAPADEPPSADDPDTDSGDPGTTTTTDTGSPDDDGTYTPGDDDDDPEEAHADADEDGLPDAVEAALGTDPNDPNSDPNDPNSDNDSLLDGEEIYTHGTNPLCVDTDGDGENDDREVEILGSDPNDPNDPVAVPSPEPDCIETDADVEPEDLSVDADGDGLTLGDELLCDGGTSDTEPDSDFDGLGDLVECGDADLDARNADSDGDTLIDGLVEVDVYGTNPRLADSDGDLLDDFEELFVYGTDPNAASSDSDPLTDYEEVITHGTDPWDDDTDDDGLDDDVEVASTSPCDPLDDDTDDDGLLDGDEVTLGTDCSQEDTDGGGMPDGLEVAAGLDPQSSSDDVDYVGVNEVWQCTSMRADSVTYDSTAGIDQFAFDNDELYYSLALRQLGNEYTGTECVCEGVFVAELEPTTISGVTVWTEQAVHLTDIGHSLRTWGGGWTPSSTEDGTDTAIASAVALTPAWSSQTLSGYDSTGTTAGGLEVGNDSDGDASWIAFDASPVVADGLGSSGSVNVSGAVDLRVSFGNPYSRPITDCGELTYVGASAGGDDHGLQFRVDALSAAAMLPPAALPATDPQRCALGKQRQSVFGFVPRKTGGRAPLFLGGSAAYGHATIQALKVKDWRGSDWVTLTHSDGRTHTLHKDQPHSALPTGAPWHLAEVSWTMGRDAEGAFSEPVVGITHTCTVAGSPPPGPVPVDGYVVAYTQLDQVLAGLGLTGVLQARWPELTDLTHTPLRARVIVPDRWVDGPTQAALRIDAAGGPTLWTLPLDPVLDPALRSVTPPRDVRSWTIDRKGARHSIEARLTQTATDLTIHLDRLTLGGSSMVSLEAPLTLTLPAE